ncbi:MAG: glycosyltransferase family 39 protein [Patescibacteria group bacterium]
MLKFVKNYYPLLFILLLGLILRIWGISWDWPLSSTTGDEIKIISGSLNMINDASLFPRYVGGTYMPLMYYLHLPAIAVYAAFLFVSGHVHSINDIKNSVVMDLGNWLMISRFISVFLGCLSIFLMYLVSQRIFNNKTVSYIAALLFAVSPLNVALGHFGKIWTPQVFFLILSLYLSLRFWQNSDRKPSFKMVFFTALFILFSFAVNLVGALAYPLLLLILFVYYCECNWKRFFTFLISRWSILLHLLLVVGVALVFLVAPDSFKVYGLVFGIFFTVTSGASVQEQGPMWELPWWQKTGLVFDIFLQFETIIFLLLVPAFWLLYKKSKKIFCFLFLSFLGFFILLCPPLVDTTRPRYLTLLIPLMILPVAYLIKVVIDQFSSKRRWLIPIIILVAVMQNIFINARYDRLLQKGSTKLSAYDWIKDNVSPDQKVFLAGYYLLQDLPPDKELVSLVKQYSPEYYSTRLKYLEDNFLDKPQWQGYGVYSDGFFCQWPEEVRSKIKFDYIIIADSGPGNFDFKDFKICGSQPSYDLTEKTPVFRQETAPYYRYTIDSGISLESYGPLWRIKKLGKELSIYKTDK